MAAQRIGSPAADYSKTTDSENHFFYQMAAAGRAEGGQVEPVLGGFKFQFSLAQFANIFDKHKNLNKHSGKFLKQ